MVVRMVKKWSPKWSPEFCPPRKWSPQWSPAFAEIPACRKMVIKMVKKWSSVPGPAPRPAYKWSKNGQKMVARHFGAQNGQKMVKQWSKNGRPPGGGGLHRNGQKMVARSRRASGRRWASGRADGWGRGGVCVLLRRGQGPCLVSSFAFGQGRPFIPCLWASGGQSCRDALRLALLAKLWRSLASTQKVCLWPRAQACPVRFALRHIDLGQGSVLGRCGTCWASCQPCRQKSERPPLPLLAAGHRGARLCATRPMSGRVALRLEVQIAREKNEYSRH